MIGFDWDFIWGEGYNGLGKFGYTPRSMRANEKQGISDPKMNGPNDHGLKHKSPKTQLRKPHWKTFVEKTLSL